MRPHDEPIIVKIESQRVTGYEDFPYISAYSTTIENIGIGKDGKRYRFYTTFTTDKETGMTRIGMGYGYVEIEAAQP